MPSYEVLQISTVEGADVSASGEDAVFCCVTPEGAKVNLAIPVSQLRGLATLASSADGKAQQILQADPKAKAVYAVDWWEIDQSSQDDSIVFCFRVPGGMELSFQVPRVVADRMQETINALLGRVQNAPHGKPQ